MEWDMGASRWNIPLPKNEIDIVGPPRCGWTKKVQSQAMLKRLT